MKIKVKIMQAGDREDEAVEVKGKDGMTVAEALKISRVDLKRFDLVIKVKECNKETKLKDGDLLLLL